MKITITKGRSDDQITIRRSDGSMAKTRFPKKGPVPHDAVHLFVEQGLGLVNAFWGMVAAGHHPDELAELAKVAGHASASRAQIPGAAIIELLQAERLTECFEAELWSNGGDDAMLLAVAETACAASHIPLPAIAEGAIGRVREALGGFARVWIAAPTGYTVTLDWQGD